MKAASTTVRLQKMGFVPAIRYSEVEVGDRLLYNHGFRYTVTAVSHSGAWAHVTVKSEKTGNEWTNRRLLKSAVAYIGTAN
jgi:hypothetical protein